MSRGFGLLLALAALGACDRFDRDAPPSRAPGLWVQTVSSAGMTQQSRLCVDAAVEAAFGWWGQTTGACAKPSVTRGPDGGWRFNSRCDMGPAGVNATTGVATGDFSAADRMQAETITTAAAAPQMNGAHKMTLEAAWQGPCPAGMKPGDMTLPGGMKINLLEVAAAK